MANEDEILSFDITEDDLNEAKGLGSGFRRRYVSLILPILEFSFNVCSMNSRGKQSKEYATYGIWAGDDQDSDASDPGSSRPSFGGGRKKGAANYTAPVGFISAGIVGVCHPELHITLQIM